MKNFILMFFALWISTSVGFGQITEGHITFKLEMTSDNPEMQAAAAMLQGSLLDIYFVDKSTRSEMKMGSMMNVTSVTNEKSGDVLMLMSGMVGFNAIKTTIRELEDGQGELPKMDISLVEEKKDILGYPCKKAILTDDQGTESVFWYTESIQASKKGQSYLNDKVPGFPLEYDISNSGIKMTLTATSVIDALKKKEKDELFKMDIPEGYKQMTLADLKKMGMN
jgi:GLPGLI family protein